MCVCVCLCLCVGWQSFHPSTQPSSEARVDQGQEKPISEITFSAIFIILQREQLTHGDWGCKRIFFNNLIKLWHVCSQGLCALYWQGSRLPIRVCQVFISLVSIAWKSSWSRFLQCCEQKPREKGGAFCLLCYRRVNVMVESSAFYQREASPPYIGLAWLSLRDSRR